MHSDKDTKRRKHIFYHTLTSSFWELKARNTGYFQKCLSNSTLSYKSQSKTIDQRSHSNKDTKNKKDRLCIVIGSTIFRVNSLTWCLHKSKLMMVIALNNLAKAS